MKRWKCPSCGNGVLAPEKPRMKDVRRYCLDCSAVTGFLVERTCPALDKKREAKAAVRKEQAVVKRAKEKAQLEASHMIGDLNLREMLDRAIRLPCFEQKHRKRLWTIKLHIRRNKVLAGYAGRAFHGRNMIQVTENVWWNKDHALDTLLHELAHMCVYHFNYSAASRTDRNNQHGPTFRKWYHRLVASWNGTYPEQQVEPDRRWAER